MLTYSKNNITAKNGLNNIRAIVEETGSLFHKIEWENDLGIDAIIELIRDEKPLNKQIAVQIKAGESYFNQESNQCLIPIGKHYHYWLNYPLSVFGVVYVPSLKCGYWVDIQNYLKKNENESVIRFEISELNRFDNSSFVKLFMPKILSEIPDFSLQEAIKYFNSNKNDEFQLGLIILFRKYINSFDTWDCIINFFIQKPLLEIPNNMIYYLAHIPWHPDILYSGELISHETRLYSKNRLMQFGKREVLKLLNFIDEEDGISRGTLGQSVEAIISIIPNSNSYLSEIIQDSEEVLPIRQFAALIFAMNNGKKAIPIISKLSISGSWYADELINHLNKYDGISPYV